MTAKKRAVNAAVWFYAQPGFHELPASPDGGAWDEERDSVDGPWRSKR